MYVFCKIMFICCKIIVIPQDFPLHLLRKIHTLRRISISLPWRLGKIVTCLKTMFICCKIMCRYGFVTIPETREKACSQRFTVHDCRRGEQKQGLRPSHRKQNMKSDQGNVTTGGTIWCLRPLSTFRWTTGTIPGLQKWDWDLSIGSEPRGGCLFG